MLTYEQIIRHTMGVLFGLAFGLAFWGGWWSGGSWWLAILLFIVVDLAFLKLIKSLK